MRNLKLILEYDGTNYHGWQIQPVAVTIEKNLKTAVEEICKEEIKIIGCSRTDAGVHAKGYVCNFFTNCKIPAEKVPIAVNTKLPYDIRVLDCLEVSKDFNSRISAKNKTYKYFINNSGVYDVFLRNYQWNFPIPLDFDKMEKAAKYFLGEHDFSGFMSVGSEVLSTIRTINFLNLKKNNGIIEIEINGDGFLYNMVRIITGTLVYVGLGKILPCDISSIILSKNRKNAGMTAPPQGLFLWEVNYA